MKYEILIVLLMTIRIRRIWSEDDFPKLEDLFPTLSPEELEPAQNFDIEMEAIDLEKFQKKLDQLESQLIGNDTLPETYAVDARRQEIPYIYHGWWRMACDDLIKVKSIDLMLQHIYMARYQVRVLEREGYYKPTDTAYRVAFLYRKLRRHCRRMKDIYTMQVNKEEKLYAIQSLVMHQKVIKLYEEYMFLWWLLIKLDGKYQMSFFIQEAQTKATKDVKNVTDMELQDDEISIPDNISNMPSVAQTVNPPT